MGPVDQQFCTSGSEGRVFTNREPWAEIRRCVLTGEISKRRACGEYGLRWQTLLKVLTHVEPSDYRRTMRRASNLDPFLPVVNEILAADEQVHRKQRHPAQRIFERLRDEYGYTGCLTQVRNAVWEIRQRSKEVFLPLSHPP